MRLWTRALLVGAVGLGAGGAVGCAEERPPINRVQPNALAKSFFVGEDLQDEFDNPEFYAQGTVIDVGYGAAQDGLFTSTYAQPVSRIKWQVTEDILIGRLAYERINDSDGKAGVGNPTAEGQIAYMYPITSHFDIRRDYNPTTGEESNVVVENTSDRPWDQREFMRVDWSRNMNTNAYDYDTLSLIGVYGGVSYEPVSYYVNDPDHADAPVFDVEDGYFDVTNKALATPGLIDLSHLGWGIDSFPSCYLENDFFGGTAPAGNCNPVEITLRQAFRKVEKDDFEPQNWDGRRFQAAGAFYVERNGYARNYGMVDEKWHRFITRYDIWERSHYYDDLEEMTGEIACNVPMEAVEGLDDDRVVGTPYGGDPHRDLDNNGTEDECEAVTKETKIAGSRCDEFKQKCTLPYQARVARPIVWNYTKNSHPKYFEGTEWATHEWDVAMRVAVQAAKYAECTRVKALGDEQNFRLGDGNGDGLDDECVAKYPLYSGQQDDNQDAIALAREVDDCRAGIAYKGENCDDVAQTIATQRGYQPGVLAIARQPEMVVLCHGPVEAGDPEACGEPRLPADITAADCDREWQSETPDQEIVAQCNEAKVVRIGDLRYHQVNVIRTPQTPSPWGIYTDSEDPLWGNKIAASINIWSHVNDLFSQGVVDMVRYMQGELATEEITDGKYVSDWAAAEESSRRSGAGPMLTRDQVDARIAATSWQASRGTQALVEKMPSDAELVQELRANRDNPAKHAEAMAKARPVIERMRTMRADPTAPSVSRPIVDARRIAAQDTPTEAAIMTPAMQQLTQVDGAHGLPPEAQKEFSSLFRGLNPSIRKDLRQAKEAALAARGACILHEAPTPNSMAGLSKVLIQKFGDWRDGNRNGTIEEAEQPLDADARTAHFDRMKEYLAQRAQYAVIIHEMGHSIGLRHNFVSSSNAAFYRPQYWQLRTKNGTVTEECHDLVADGGTCVGPRYFDPPTDEENDQLLHMFMQSSVMDYAGENTQDLIGLGAYDFHAARMFYGDVMSVHADDDFRVWQPRGKGILGITDNFGGILGYQHISTGVSTRANGSVHAQGDFVNYSKLNMEYGLIENCTPVGNSWDEVEAKFKPANWNDARDGRWHPVVDGQIVAVDGVYTRCRQRKVDYVAYDKMRIATVDEYQYPNSVDGYSGYAFTGQDGGRAVDPIGRTRVPYAFASDNWADTGNVSVFRHDNGADMYELFNFLITEQETRHIFDNYRRDRLSFSVRSAAGRILGRYNEKMRDAAKGLGLIYNLYRDLYGYDGDTVTYQIYANIIPDNLVASGMAFDHFTRQLQRPQSGQHIKHLGALYPFDRSLPSQAAPIVTIPDGATGYFGNVGYGGKLLENRLANDQGDYDSSFTMNAGSYYDKLYVPYLLTESADNFISDSIDDFVDARYRSVSMADLFPAGFQRMLGTMLTQDETMKGAFLEAGESGGPLVDFQSKFPTRPLGWTSFWTPEASICFPGEGSTVCSSMNAENEYGAGNIDSVVAVATNVDWELWKFLVVQTMLYLPENSRPAWINQLGIWEIGADTDPAFENRIELHSPDGKVFVAATSGRETILGKNVERGIAARMLEQANALMVKAFQTVPAGPGAIDEDGDGVNDGFLDDDEDGFPDLTVWYEPVIVDGNWVQLDGPAGFAGAQAFQDYQALLMFVRQTMMDFRMADPTMKGLYD